MAQSSSPRHYGITGVCGSVGSALLRHLLTNDSSPDLRVIGLDHDENGIFRLEEQYADDPRATFFVGDVRDRLMLRRRLRGVQTLFHTAALKHVYQCEKAPLEALRTNVLGVSHVLDAARAVGIERVIVTSTDKAVNPTSVMGTTKLMAERLVTAAHSDGDEEGPVCASTRFGNVLGSNGSVLEVFRRQIFAGVDLTVTDERMTRFVMDMDEALRLLVETVELARGGEVFITKMSALRIVDLAQAAIRRWAPRAGRRPEAVGIRLVGARPGEKLYEELMTGEESRRAFELDHHFVILPAFRPLYRRLSQRYAGESRIPSPEGYRSDVVPLMTASEIDALLERLDAAAGEEWP